MFPIKAASFGTPKASSSPATRRSSQVDAKRRFRRAGRLAAASLSAAALALVGASSASAAALLAYVSNAKSDLVTGINVANGNVEALINVGVDTSSIAITPNGLQAFAPEFEGEALIPINLKTNKAETAIKLTGKKLEPESVTITPNGLYAYVTDEEANKVEVVDTATNEVVKTIAVGEEPEGIAFTPNGELAYVADKATEHQGTVTVIEKASSGTNAKVMETINIGIAKECKEEKNLLAHDCVEPEKVAVSPNGLFAYVADGADGAVTVIETATNEVAKTITGVGLAEVGNNEPDNIVIAPNGLVAYAADGTLNTVVPINLKTNKAETAIPVGLAPHGLAITADGKLVVVADEEEANVKTIATATNTVAATFTLFGEPDGVAVTP